ncbi:MAG: ribosome small subunit-dependent GTPase A [Gemmatimonadetes bacterium]|nr:ribosome small subunit-dependent GTPase A [Gemmatimonadota bacterium]
MLDGLVVRAHGSSFGVELGDETIVDCTMRGRHRLLNEAVTSPLTVGDRVRVKRVEEIGEGESQGTIEEILPRRNKISRTASGEVPLEQVLAANVDGVAAIFAYRGPRADPRLVQRLLLAAETGGVEPILVLNKLDLARRKELRAAEELATLLKPTGYLVLGTSALTGEGLDELRTWMAGKTCAFVGPSGAGKSSLANAMAPGLGLRVGAISRKTGTGRHTTSWASLVRMPNGARLVDTPGIGILDTWGVDPEDLVRWLPDLAPYGGSCEWRNCGHRAGEVGCALAAAVEAGEIARERLVFYRDMYATLEQRRDRLEEHPGEGARPEPESDWEERWVED